MARERLLEAAGQEQLTVILTATRLQERWKVLAKLALFTGIGIAGRVALQYVPSVEPITPLAIAFAFFFGPIYGIIPGALGFYLSNFLVWGGQGPWTIFQVLGVVLATIPAGIAGKLTQNRKVFYASALVGLAVYEFIVDLSWGFTFGDWNPVTMFISALPFSLVHISSGLGFALLLYEARERLLDYLKGEVHEIKILASRLSPDSARYLDGSRASISELTIRKHYNDRQIEYKRWGVSPANKLWKRDH